VRIEGAIVTTGQFLPGGAARRCLKSGRAADTVGTFSGLPEKPFELNDKQESLACA